MTLFTPAPCSAPNPRVPAPLSPENGLAWGSPVFEGEGGAGCIKHLRLKHAAFGPGTFEFLVSTTYVSSWPTVSCAV